MVESAPRVPSGMPFVVNPRVWRTLALFWGILLLFLPFPLFFIVLGAVVEGPVVLGMGVALLAFMVGMTALVSFIRWRLLIYRGPFLGAGPEGFWIRVRPYSSTAVWLPWSEIRAIEMVGPGLLGQLRVYPVQVNPAHGPRPYLFSLFGADRSREEILRQLTVLSAGRVPIAAR